MKNLLISIKPKYAQAILSGQKSVELRRRIPSLETEKLYIYETSPTKAIVGVVDVVKVVSDSPADLWNLVADFAGVSKSEFDDYFQGAKLGHGFFLANPQRFTSPIPLKEVGINAAPQSWLCLPPEHLMEQRIQKILNKKPSLTFASLFGGGRLADIGAMLAGHELIWDVELDPKIAEVGSMLPGRVYNQSVTEVDWNKVDRPNILWASPPCPNFSAAKRHGVETAVDREVAGAVVGAIKTLQPRYFILENVEGYKHGQSLQQITSALFEQGYWVNWQILNSADFGVPQTRRRLILRAVKNGFLPDLPAAKPWVGWYAAIQDLISNLPESELAPWQKNRMAEIEIHELWNDFWLVPGANAKSVSFPARRAKEPSFTVTATNQPRAILGETVVSLTPHCLARFQSVPDWYLHQMPCGRALASKIIGNGVPCLMAKGVIESFVG